jgi:hypothetical protein
MGLSERQFGPKGWAPKAEQIRGMEKTSRPPARTTTEAIQCLTEIGNQVLRVFDAYRVANESLRNAAGRALFGRRFYMAGGCRGASNGFYRA